MSLPVVILGSVVFNSGTFGDQCAIEGWHATAGRDAPIIARGGRGGALPGGRFLAKEKYLTLFGSRMCADDADALAKRVELLGQFRDDATTTLTVDWGGGPQSAEVQLYDVAAVDFPHGGEMKFTLPLVQFDPFKYGEVQQALMGAYTPAPWMREFTIDTAPDPDKGYRTYLQRTNLCTNPSLETNTTSWSAGGTVPPTITRDSTQAKYGTWALKVAWGNGGFLPLAQCSVSGLTIGETYTYSVWVYVPFGSPPVVMNAAGGFGNNSGLLTDEWVRLSRTFVATATSHAMQIWPQTAPVAGQVAYVDGFLAEQGSFLGEYFDGSQGGAWTGTAHASTSTRYGHRLYGQPIVESALPTAATIDNTGDATSSRLKVVVAGPLNAGDWQVVNETTGAALRADLSLVAGQQLVLDMYEELGTLNGVPINELLRGDWLRLPPGQSTIRLESSTQQNGASAKVTAYPAYQ